MEIVTLGNEVMQGDEVITLKEITDILEVRHNDAMKKVESLSKEPSFGQLRKSRISYAKGKSVGTYLLNKIQAIAVGAKLNDKLLMKLVTKLEKPKSNFLQMDIHLQRIEALTDASKTMMGNIENLNERTSNLEKNRRLEAWQERSLQDAKNKKVYELAPKDKDLQKQLHRKVWSLFKKKFHLPRYNELKSGQYENGLEYIHNLTMAEMVA